MTLVINDLEQDEQLDRAAMKTIAGSGLFTMRQWQVTQQYYDRIIDSAGSQYEMNRELRRAALGIMDQHYSYQSSIIQKITS